MALIHTSIEESGFGRVFLLTTFIHYANIKSEYVELCWALSFDKFGTIPSEVEGLTTE